MREARKKCTKCKEFKSFTEFHARTRATDGRLSRCKACARALRIVWDQAHRNDPAHKAKEKKWHLNWYANNKKRHRAYSKAWALAHPDAAKEAGKRYRARNPDIDRIRGKEYQDSHVEELRQYRKINANHRKLMRKRYLDANPGVEQAWWAARRAQERSAMPSWADKTAIAEVYRAAKDKTKETGIVWHVDHIVPLQHKRVCGLHIAINLQLLTAAENMAKKNRFIIE